MHSCFSIQKSGSGATPFHCRSVRALSAALLLTVSCALHHVSAAEPTDHWLQRYGLQRWQIVFDHDGDRYTTGEEFDFGTDPLNADSHPSLSISATNGVALHLSQTPGTRTELLTTTDFNLWEAVPNLPAPVGPVLTLDLLASEPQRFYRIGSLVHTNSDGDCLLDFEELTLYGTNPFLTDTDGDGIDDCDEVLLYHTDPNYNSPTGRGAISGKVVLDEDGDPATTNHSGLGGWKVFLDLDYDGQPGSFEPSAVTQADGSYLIQHVDPGLYRVRMETRAGWAQVFPALIPISSPDGYPDRVVSFFDSGMGPIPGPFGKNADPLPGLRLLTGLSPQPVEASIVLGAPPPPPISAPVGAWAHVDWLSLPLDSTITVAFDGEEIIDGPGADLIIHSEAQGPEQVELYLGSTESSLTFAGIIPSDDNIPVDLATLAVPQPVRFLELKALDSLGTFPGFELVGFTAVNYRALPVGHYDVTVMGGETVSNISFGVLGSDRPPQVFISLDNSSLNAGQSALATVTASDDVGISSVTFRVNGVTTVLDANLQAQVTPGSGGLLELSATATDTAGQTGDTLLQIVIRNADGTSPDLSGYGITGGSGGGGPRIQITSPVAGEIHTAPRDIIGTISGSTSAVATWRVDYALADLVNPEALADPDPDYVMLSQGAGPVTSASLGTLAGDTLPAGAYLLRVSAADLNGTTAYLGFVIGVRVDPLDIRPEIVITTPTNETTVTFITNIIGSITTRQTLREYYVEYAPLSTVNLQNLAAANTTWTRIASGTNPVVNGALAIFDTTLVPNDSYVIRVTAWNRNGLGWAEPVVVHVTGNAKLGNFALEFTDVDLPLAGIPITVKRVYNSLNASRSGDFGYGWSLGVQDADIAETIPQTGAGFSSTPFRVGTRVYLTAPDGKRIGFTFQPEIRAVSFLGAAYAAIFKPDPGIAYTLSVPEGETAFLTINSAGEAALFFIPLPWNPNIYILTDRDGTSYTYDQKDGLIEIQDDNGNRVTFSQTAIQHSAGPLIQLVRDGQGRITQIIEQDGRSTTYHYDANGDLVQVVYPESIQATFGYHATREHYLDTINDPLKTPSQRIEYGDDGRVAAIIDADGNRREQVWNPGAFTGTFTDGRGNITEIIYDERGNILQETKPLGTITTYAYGDPLNPDKETAITDPRGNTTTYEYDERGNLTKVDRALRRHDTQYTYDSGNRIISITYATGGREDFEYDPDGNFIAVQSPAGDWAYTYTANGLLASKVDGEGGVTRYEYDEGFRQPNRVVHPDGTVDHYQYDSRGLVTGYTDATGALTRQEYDGLGRVIKQVDPLGGEITATYDATFPSQLATATDRMGRVTRQAYDSMGRIESTIDPGGGVTRYEYDADGNRTAVVDPVGNRTEYTYDALNRLVRETDPSGNTRHHQYDPAGNRIESIDGNGRKRTFVYDALNRRTEERWHDATNDTVILRTIRSTFDRLDRITEMADSDATLKESFLPVPNGQVETTRAIYPGRAERLMTFDYDEAGRRTQWSLFGELTVRMTRDQVGNLRILTADRDVNTRWRVEMWRNAHGDTTELRRFSDLAGANPVGLNTIFTVDPRRWLNRIEHRDGNGQEMTDKTLTYTRAADGGIDAILDGTDSKVFSYDPAAQLTGVMLNGSGVENYGFDLNGNRLTSHRHNTYATGSGNRVEQAGLWTYQYDGEGNVASKGDGTTLWNYIFDHRNRLTTVEKTIGAGPAATVAEYRYDARNRRIAIVHGAQTTWSYFDGEQCIADYLDEENNDPEALYLYNERIDDLHAIWRRGEGVFWTLTDNLGTVRHVTDLSGSDMAHIEYDAFGNILSKTGTNPDAAGRFAFTGREKDEESGLYYYRARYYDPDLGRFISSDPLGFEAGDANLYRYVVNRPNSFTDPTGRNAFIETAKIIAGLSAAFLIGGLAGGQTSVNILVARLLFNFLFPPQPPGRPAPRR